MKKSALILSLFFIFSAAYADAAVLFSDNFDSWSNWTETQYTNTSSQCWNGCSMTGGWTGYLSALSQCGSGITGRPGNNSIYANSIAGYPSGSTACRGGTGKCWTHWQEACLAPKTNFDDADAMFGKDLGAEYEDVYLRFYIRFPANFTMTDEMGFKLWHVQHWANIATPWNYHERDTNNQPVGVGGIRYYEGYLDLFAEARGYPTYQMHNYIFWRIYPYTAAKAPGGLLDGNWHQIIVRTKRNSAIGVADGLMEVWVDGLKKTNFEGYESNNINWTQSGSDLRGFKFVSIGGNNMTWTTACSDGSGDMSECEQPYSIDDVAIATTLAEALAGGGGDTTPPMATITAPTSAATYSVATTPLSLGGTASDSVGVTSVSYSNSTGGNGTCTGTTSWTCSNIALAVGSNVITVTARDAAGNTGTDLITVTYTSSDTTAPSTPTNLSASAVSSSQINLSWTASTDNVGVTGYRIYRNGSQIATSATNSYQNTGLSPSTTYNYTVSAYDASNNNSSQSSQASATTQTAPPIGTGLNLAYSFDQSSGTTLTDYSGNNFSGTLINGPTWATGHFGNALSFDGLNDYVSLSVITFPGPFTLSLWYNDLSSEFGHLVSGNVLYGPKLYDNGSNFLFRAVSSADTNASKGIQGVWHYVAVSRDANNKVDIYVDGGAANRLFSDIAQVGNFSVARLGSDETNGANWNGLLDNLRVYNRVLSASEILSDMNTAIGAPPDTTSPANPTGLTVN